MLKVIFLNQSYKAMLEEAGLCLTNLLPGNIQGVFTHTQIKEIENTKYRADVCKLLDRIGFTISDDQPFPVVDTLDSINVGSPVDAEMIADDTIVLWALENGNSHYTMLGQNLERVIVAMGKTIPLTVLTQTKQFELFVRQLTI